MMQGIPNACFPRTRVSAMWFGRGVKYLHIRFSGVTNDWCHEDRETMVHYRALTEYVQ